MERYELNLYGKVLNIDCTNLANIKQFTEYLYLEVLAYIDVSFL